MAARLQPLLLGQRARRVWTVHQAVRDTCTCADLQVKINLRSSLAARLPAVSEPLTVRK